MTIIFLFFSILFYCRYERVGPRVGDRTGTGVGGYVGDRVGARANPNWAYKIHKRFLV